MISLPILRFGRPYKSLDVARAVHYQTREPLAEVSQANLGLIRRDLMQQEAHRAVLARIPAAELVAMGHVPSRVRTERFGPSAPGERS